MAMHSDSYSEQVQYCKKKQEGTRKRNISKCCNSATYFLFYSEKKNKNKNLALSAVSMDNSIKQH